MSKEEILYNQLGGFSRSMLSDEDIYQAMDIYAKETAIEFAKWIPQNAYIAEDEYFYELLKNGVRVSEQTLYEMFIYELKSKSDPNDLPPTVGGGFGGGK